MSFSEILRQSIEQVDGAVMASILGTDGMTVEQYPHADEGLNLEEFTAETSQPLSDMSKAIKTAGLGDVEEYTISTTLYKIIMRRINAEYYVAMMLVPGGNAGKGRFVLKKIVPVLKSEF